MPSIVRVSTNICTFSCRAIALSNRVMIASRSEPVILPETARASTSSELSINSCILISCQHHPTKFLDRSYPDSGPVRNGRRSEEQTSELQSLMRSSYTAFCLKKNTTDPQH